MQHSIVPPKSRIKYLHSLKRKFSPAIRRNCLKSIGPETNTVIIISNTDRRQLSPEPVPAQKAGGALGSRCLFAPPLINKLGFASLISPFCYMFSFNSSKFLGYNPNRL
ncbi:hypothetical protein CW304_21785 [Bacillus sp. UFRGS-B20]|nr:hypothetical protein CW304_21785 [Bacillus sp. UFRGS-B20]